MFGEASLKHLFEAIHERNVDALPGEVVDLLREKRGLPALSVEETLAARETSADTTTVADLVELLRGKERGMKTMRWFELDDGSELEVVTTFSVKPKT